MATDIDFSSVWMASCIGCLYFKRRGGFNRVRTLYRTKCADVRVNAVSPSLSLLSRQHKFYLLFVALLRGRDGRPRVAPTGSGVSFSCLYLLGGVFDCAGFRRFVLVGYEYGRGDQWSPAFCERNFYFLFVALLRGRDGRPMVAPTGVERPGANGRSGEQPGTGAGRSGGKQVEGGATGTGAERLWASVRGGQKTR